jgi:hypothetical protein
MSKPAGVCSLCRRAAGGGTRAGTFASTEIANSFSASKPNQEEPL